MQHQTLDELIDRHDGVETVQRDGVLDTGIVCIEGDNIVNAHPDQLLQRDCAVQRLTHGALMLPALVQIRHDDGDPAGFAADSGNDAL